MKIMLVLFLLAIAVDGYQEGDNCIKEGVAGVCQNIRKCLAALQDIKNRKEPQLCDFTGMDPIVCCVSSVNITTMASVLTTTKSTSTSTADYEPPIEYDYFDGVVKEKCDSIPPSLTATPTGQKAWDKCLEYQEKAVFPCAKSQALDGVLTRSNRCHHSTQYHSIGGGAAERNEFTHMAMLGYGEDRAKLWWLCGGSLISERFVLTAAHCTFSRDAGMVTYVRLGTLRFSNTAPRNRRKVKNIVKHPQYNPPIRYHDIALLELNTIVQLDEFTVPACVHVAGDAADESRAAATGWGLVATNMNTSDDLQKTILTKYKAEECGEAFKPTRLMRDGFDERSQTCYGDKEKSGDACQYDSGSPLQIKNKQISCMYTILGVSSFGTTCGNGVPRIFTRVAHYLDWIESTVWP